jgi:hypothetical protein
MSEGRINRSIIRKKKKKREQRKVRQKEGQNEEDAILEFLREKPQFVLGKSSSSSSYSGKMSFSFRSLTLSLSLPLTCIMEHERVSEPRRRKKERLEEVASWGRWKLINLI